MQRTTLKAELIWTAKSDLTRSQVGFDGHGRSFHLNTQTVYLCDGDANTLHILSLRDRSHKRLRAPFGRERYPAGVYGKNGTLYFLLRDLEPKSATTLLECDPNLKPKRKLRFFETFYCLPPVWLHVSNNGKSIYTGHRGFYEGQGGVRRSSVRLAEYTMKEGTLVWALRDIEGYAYDEEQDMFWVAGCPASQPKMREISCPKELKNLDSRNLSWILIGLDRNGNFYWYRDAVDLRFRGEVLELETSSEIACTRSSGQVVWVYSLTGERGLLSAIEPSVQLTLGWGGDWIEVVPSGEIYVLAGGYHPKKGERMALFRLSQVLGK